MNSVTVHFTGPAGVARVLVIEKDMYICADGFGIRPHIWPVTLVPARYGGAYEGGLQNARWLAFPVAPHTLLEESWKDWEGDDLACMAWWDAAAGYPIGRGVSPQAAYDNLLDLACSKAGMSVADFTESPSWPESTPG